MAAVQPRPFLFYCSLLLNLIMIVVVLFDDNSNCSQPNAQNVALPSNENVALNVNQPEVASITTAAPKKIVPDIFRTTKIVKCDAEKTNLINYSLLYLDNTTDARQYGCKAVEMLDWALTLRSKEKRHFSQNGEDGLLAEIFSKIGEKSRFFVEFGVQDATVCNTRYFREKGWKGIMFDNNNNNTAIGLHRTAVWVDNVVQLFQTHNVPESFDLLSVDTDFNDFWNLREIMLAGYKARVVIVEVNVASGPYSSFSVPRKVAEDHGMFPGVRWFGGSVLAYAKLMHKFGYQLLSVESTVTNAVFVKKLRNQ